MLSVFRSISQRVQTSHIAMYSTSGRPFTICVEGNIASGKSSFLKHFQNHPEVAAFTEPVDAWRNLDGHNLLNLTYKDAKKWCFTFQTYVQLTMVMSHEALHDKPIKMMERSLFSARYCFVENAVKEELISEQQLAVLDKWLEWLLRRSQVSCDLIVYLRADPETVYKRMQARCRDEEKNISLEFLQKLHKLHEDWLYHKTTFPCPAPVLVLDANKDTNRIEEEYLHCEERINDLSLHFMKEHKSMNS